MKPSDRRLQLSLLFLLMGLFPAARSGGTGLQWVSRPLTPPFPLEGVRGIAESSEGTLWFASWGNGLVSYDGLHFKRYGREEGLPTLFLRTCLFDRTGSLWITSAKGVIRMRGGEFTVLRPENDFPLENTYCLAQDPQGTLFVGGDGGVVAIPRDGNFVHLDFGDAISSGATAKELYFDSEWNVLWVLWGDGSVLPVNPVTLSPSLDVPWTPPDDPGSYRCLLRDAQGFLWLSGDRDVVRLADGQWQSMKPDFVDGAWRGTRMIRGKGDRIVFVTRRGLVVRSNEEWIVLGSLYIHEASQINTVFSSTEGSLWVGTRGKVWVLHPSPFEKILSLEPSEHRLTSLLLDRENRIWVGGEALSFWDSRQWHLVEKSEDGILRHVTDIVEGKDGRIFSLWSYRGVLEWYEGTSRWLPPLPDPHQGYPCLLETSQGDLWVGTERTGVWIHADKGWKSLEDLFEGPEIAELGREKIYALLQKSDGEILIGIEGGLFSLEKDTVRRIPGPLDGTEFEVMDMIEPVPGTVLIATIGHGLYELSGTRWREIQNWSGGFGTNLITALHQGMEGEIWVGTKANGLWYSKNGGWFHLGISAGLVPCQVDSIVHHPNRDIYFVSDTVGLLRWHRDRNPPETKIETLTRNVVFGEDLVLTVSGHDFMEGTARSDLRFSYRLGDGDWSSPTVDQPIRVPALATGNHTLEVAAIDLDGNRDPSPARESFVVAHPWWRHPLTMLLGFVLLLNLSLLVGFLVQRFRNLKKILRERNEYQEKLETEVERRTKELQEAVEFREKLITNVAHDFRTPLTNLIGYAQMLGANPRKNLDDHQKEFIEVIQNNARRMKRLIENVAQSLRGDEPLERYAKTKVNLHEIAFEVFKSHALAAQDQDIELELQCGQERVEVLGSDVLIARLMDNLLSNAIKFSNPGGKVVLEIVDRGETVHLSVKDRGIGIHSQDLSRIFDRFIQVHRGVKDHVGGIGIGLSICKEIADYHRAEISVQSVLGEGSTFTVTWKKEAVPEEEIAL